MKRLRQVVFWMHLCTALCVGAVVLIMSVTGVLLTYQRQMTWWADTRGLDAAPPEAGQTRLDTDALLQRARAAVAGNPTSVTWRSAANAPAAVAFGRERVVYMNAYTGAVLREGSAAIRAFFREVTDWHRWLGVSDANLRTARRITGASNLAFLFLVLSGFYLWWPRNRTRTAVRSVVMFRRGLSGRARDFNWHNVIGFWSALPLLVIILSATVISYPWATNLLYRLAGTDAGVDTAAELTHDVSAETSPDAPMTMAQLEARAERHVAGWTMITRHISSRADAPVRFSIDRGTGGQPQKQAQLELDAATGDVLQWAPFASQPRRERLRSLLRFTHTGEAAGIIGQTLAGLVSLGAAVLVCTGFAMYIRRMASWRRRRKPFGPVFKF